MIWEISAPGDLITIDSVNNTWYKKLYLQAEKFYRYGIQANVTVKIQNSNLSTLSNHYLSSEDNFPSLGPSSILNLEDALKDESQKIDSIDEESDQESFVFLDYEEKDILELYEAAKNLPHWQMKMALINMMDINAKISAEEAKLMLMASKSDYSAIKSKVSTLLDKKHFRSLILMMLFSSKKSAEIILTELIDKPELGKLIESVENDNFLKAMSCSEIENEEVVTKLLNNIDDQKKLKPIELAAEVGNLTFIRCWLSSIKEESLQGRAVSESLLAAVDSEQDQVVKFLYENYKSFFINAIKNNNKIKENAKKQSSKGRMSAEEIYKILFSFDEDIVLSSIRSLYRSNYHSSNYIGLDGIRYLYKNEPKFFDYEGLDGIQNLFKVKEDNIQNGDNIQIKPCTTKGDGNCFFHATFGDKISNVYEAKEAAAMRGEWHKFLSQFKSLDDPKMPKPLKDQLEKVFDFFLDKPEDLTKDDPKMPKSLKDQLAKVFNFFLDKPGDLTNRSDKIKSLARETNEIIKQINEETKELKDKIIKNFSKCREFQKKIYKIIKKSIEERNTRSPSKQKPIPTIEDLRANNKELYNNICAELKLCALALKPDLDDTKYDKKYNPDFIKRSFFNNRELYKTYLDAIKSTDYFIFFEEIPILASLANTKITVYYIDPNTNRRAFQTFEPQEELLGNYKQDEKLWGKKREAIISHAEVHYSHADISFKNSLSEEHVGINSPLPHFQPNQNRKSKIVFSSITGGVVGGILSYLVATLNLWWMALGITLGLTIGFAMSYYLTEPKVENASIKMQPECITT